MTADAVQVKSLTLVHSQVQVVDSNTSTPATSTSKKRARSSSEEESDPDFGGAGQSSTRSPRAQRPKRRAAAGVGALVASVAKNDSEDSDYDEQPRQEFSDEEPQTGKKATKSRSTRRRIDSDEDDTPEPSAMDTTEPSRPVQKLKGRGVMSKAKPGRDNGDTKITARDQRKVPTEHSTPGRGEEPAPKKKLPVKRPIIPGPSALKGNGTPNLIRKPSARPADASTLLGSKDLDLTNMDTIQSLLMVSIAPNNFV